MIISYEDYLNEIIKNGVMHSMSNHQKENLIKAFYTFPLETCVQLESGEVIKFIPESNHKKNDYVHHFLTKYNNGKYWFSEKYIHALKYLKTTLNNYDERILDLRNNSSRISFVKYKPSDEKRAAHIVVCKVLKDNQIIAWTHFEAKKSYVKSLKEREEMLILEMGIIDNGGFFTKNISDYEALKRKTPLYLGSGALSELQKP